MLDSLSLACTFHSPSPVSFTTQHSLLRGQHEAKAICSWSHTALGVIAKRLERRKANLVEECLEAVSSADSSEPFLSRNRLATRSTKTSIETTESRSQRTGQLVLCCIAFCRIWFDKKDHAAGLESLECFRSNAFRIRHIMEGIKQGDNIVAFFFFLVGPFVRVGHTGVSIGQLACSNLFFCLFDRFFMVINSKHLSVGKVGRHGTSRNTLSTAQVCHFCSVRRHVFVETGRQFDPFRHELFVDRLEEALGRITKSMHVSPKHAAIRLVGKFEKRVMVGNVFDESTNNGHQAFIRIHDRRMLGRKSESIIRLVVLEDTIGGSMKTPLVCVARGDFGALGKFA
mmetsp:Transcript_3052/g.5627  ORF Transcript_3052/g.5627 Transcript_3052/m.5627 type:complete len:342 (-) Transcript_3052:1638-2663(-)